MIVMTATIALGTGVAMQHTASPDHPALTDAAPTRDDEPAAAPTAAAEAAGAEASIEMPTAAPLIPHAPARPSRRVAAPAETGETASPLPAGPADDGPVAARTATLFPSTPPPAAARPGAGFVPPVPVGPPINALARATAVQPETAALPRAQPRTAGEAFSRAETPESCTPALSLGAAPAAMLDIELHAPCHAESRLVLRHAELAISAYTDGDGRLLQLIPALQAEAEVVAAFPGGPEIRARVDVPEVEDYHRVAIQWQGDDDFALHAYEFGAEYGEPGHVSSQDGDGGAAGFITRLGDARVDWPLLAEVYSLPLTGIEQAGTVRFEVEAEVSDLTCGREMLGEALEMRGGGEVESVELTLPMPDCGGRGGFLVLKNLLPDLTIAGD
ncbi:hypothetical protein C2I36_01115 [Rhodobacteraceae bacterium WD3A24]|nr:hypothetical protein C2I36_01115 [Rhodobacteraceae bacterium WD3A24]